MSAGKYMQVVPVFVAFSVRENGLSAAIVCFCGGIVRGSALFQVTLFLCMIDLSALNSHKARLS